jgi:hypothetical protein
MKRAGCECIQYGVESASVRVLKALGKGITPEQIVTAVGDQRVGDATAFTRLLKEAGVPNLAFKLTNRNIADLTTWTKGEMIVVRDDANSGPVDLRHAS